MINMVGNTVLLFVAFKHLLDNAGDAQIEEGFTGKEHPFDFEIIDTVDKAGFMLSNKGTINFHQLREVALSYARKGQLWETSDGLVIAYSGSYLTSANIRKSLEENDTPLNEKDFKDKNIDDPQLLLIPGLSSKNDAPKLVQRRYIGGGEGMGLKFAKNMIEKAGGSMSIESSEGWTRITVSFSKWRSDQDAAMMGVIKRGKASQDGAVRVEFQYTVREGDTKYNLSNRAGIWPVKLYEDNGFANGHKIAVGNVLTIKTSARVFYYIVQEGDTIDSISKIVGLTPAKLRSLNRSKINSFKPGVEFLIDRTDALKLWNEDPSDIAFDSILDDNQVPLGGSYDRLRSIPQYWPEVKTLYDVLRISEFQKFVPSIVDESFRRFREILRKVYRVHMPGDLDQDFSKLKVTKDMNFLDFIAMNKDSISNNTTVQWFFLHYVNAADSVNDAMRKLNLFSLGIGYFDEEPLAVKRREESIAHLTPLYKKLEWTFGIQHNPEDIKRAFEELRLDTSAGKHDIEVAYRRLSLRYSNSSAEGAKTKLRRVEGAYMVLKDLAMSNVEPGGIDLNSANLNLQIKRDGRGVPLPLAQQDLAQLSNIEGLDPVILSIKPASQTALFAELVAHT
jgi:LysM repeat protein